MKIEQFISRNTNTWKELEDFSSRINKKGIKGFTSTEIKKLLRVFRISSHHLAYARTHYPDNNVVSYLNSLVGRCHNQIYSVKKFNPKDLYIYIYRDFPQLLKDNRKYIFTAFSVFAFGFLLAMIMTILNTDNAYFFLDATTVEALKEGISEGGRDSWNNPFMASFITVNNVGVAIKAFVLGITLGIGTIYILSFNGAILGVYTALAYRFSDPTLYWSLILPHGVIELTAIFLAGGAGLIIGRSLLIPGEHTRKHALILAAKKAVSIIAGTAMLLVIAGMIEGFFTPLSISKESKLIFASLTAVLLALYFYIPYRKARSRN